ncbi:MAG: hypothetical protein J6I85_01530 [Clostridia bacterium]|nr:hypothetical protein [Clostridia bacterium]
MENAAKALLMAGGVLIGILILTLAAYLYASFGGTSQIIQDRMDKSELNQFNNKFISYQSKECTIYDIVSVVNLANEFNEKNGFEDSSSDYIKVYLQRSLVNPNVSTVTVNYLKGFLYGEDTGVGSLAKYELYKYTCTPEINQDTERVNKVVFDRKP